jgi:hypothetical protein
MKMKGREIQFVCIAMLFGILMVCCSNVDGSTSTNNENDNEIIQSTQSTTSPSAGWYIYTTNADTEKPQVTYLYINTSGDIERAGSTADEYTGNQLEDIQKQLSFSICKKNEDGVKIKFSIEENEPSWATKGNLNPYTEYLDCAINSIYCGYSQYDYYKETSWPLNKNIQLWSANEYSYEASCSADYGTINSNNVFVIGKSMKIGDTLKIYMYDKEGIKYNCSITFE